MAKKKKKSNTVENKLRSLRDRVKQTSLKLSNNRDELRKLIEETEELVESCESTEHYLGTASNNLEWAADEMSKYV